MPLSEVPDVLPACTASCFESWSSLSIISVSRTVVVVLVPPSVVPESAVSSDRSSEEELLPSSDVRREESLSLPKSAESVLSPVVEDRPRSDDAVSPVPRVLELDELELLEADELEELSEVETPPTESEGIEGMEGPEISGMLSEGMLCAAGCVMVAASSSAMRTAMRADGTVSFLQHRQLFFDHFKA